MKRFVFMFTIAFMLIFSFYACSNIFQTNSPTASAKAWIQAFEKGDATALGKVSTPESAVRTSRYMSVMQAQLASNPVQSYAERISSNGNTAVVTVTFRDNSTDTIELVKTDGKWLVSE